ncbi:MAG: sulfatase-like hydrolase/transferase [Planctomycetes bacterium]|nr:sulfatase-like hydrolase/transferase [Planctomycetota bacterium]MBL7143985.1 sulfatase-like hydrolase/transferase [Phycisphaerae bacterium]
MNRRNFLKAAGIGIASLAMPGCANGLQSGSGAADSNKPNIVFIMADDMGYGDLGCYNKKSKIPTPNMDRLAAEGMRFTDAHSPSAVCTPTRYGVLTGQYCWRSRLKSGVLGGYSPALIDTERMTVASMLKQYGYSTACIGKWHLGLGNAKKTDYDKPLVPGPNALGFDYFYGIPASLDMTPYCYIENERPVEKPTLTIEEGKASEDGWWRAGAIAPGFKHVEVLPKLTEKAVKYIDDHTKTSPDKPFFMYFPLPAPHCPIAPADFVKGKSKAGGYGDFVVEVDWTVGQVVKALQRNGLTGNTLIFLTSDNGSPGRTKIKRDPYSIIEIYGHYPNGDLRGIKADAWDGGHREPFIARWPGRIPAGTTNDEIICLTDLMATCAAIVGAKLPENAAEDSFNILPALSGHKLNKPIREAIVHHSSIGIFSIRQGKWKLILGLGSGGFTKPQRVEPEPGGPAGQLYNLEDDLAESNNLWSKHPEIVERLTKLLEKYKEQGRTRPI